MAVFRQRGRKTWQIRLWVHGRGVRSVSSGTTDRKLAEAREKELRYAVKAKAKRDRIASILSDLMGDDAAPVAAFPIAGAFERYAKLPHVDACHHVMVTRSTHWSRLVSWLAEQYPGVTELRDLTAPVCAEFGSWLRGECATPKTYNNVRGNIVTVFRALMPVAGIDRSPWEAVRMAPPDPEAVGRAFTDDELSRLLLAIEGTVWEGAVLCGLYTGLRYRDVAHLRWDQMKDGVISLTPGKTSRHRIAVTVPIHPRLAAWFSRQAHDTSGYVFPILHHHYGSYTSEFGNLLRAAEIDNRLTFHSLRHTMRTRLAAAGVDQGTAMKLLGHTSPTMSARYNHDTTSAQRAVASLP